MTDGEQTGRHGLEPGIDREHLDAGVRPQDDLFGHVNGGWLATAEIPDDRAVDGAFYTLRDRAEEALRAIVEEAAALAAAPVGAAAPLDQLKVGDLYASFMDVARVEALGHSPIAADLAAVRAVTDAAGVVALAGRLSREGGGGVVAAYVDTDAKDPDRYLLHLQQSGLGLPDESYYRDDAFASVRAAYVEHLAALLDLVGWADPGGAGSRVLALETRLAAAHWDRVRSRDATQTYNLLTREGLDALAPGLDWAAWAGALGAGDSALAEVVVRQPDAVGGLAAALREVPVATWRDWLAVRVVGAAAAYLSTDLVECSFDFYGRTLTGAPQLRERWKRGVSVVEGAMGEAVGRLYVERHFPPEAKARMQSLVGYLVAAYREAISGLEWMSPPTRQRALDKLAAFTPKIGYPDTWRDYSALRVERHDLLGNVRRAAAFETQRELGKLGGPVDRAEWFMTPQTVNAYYNPGLNEIVFPAAILQRPFFGLTVDDAANFGAIGAVIGHEIGHGFDDQGSKYDGRGALVDWWTAPDRARFDERAQALIAQFATLEPRDLPGHRVNGALTVGENIGDLAGVSIALQAYEMSLAGDEPPDLGGWTGHQRFFLSWAHAWRAKARTAEAVRRLSVDPHSPPEFRCNIVRNLDAFHRAFAVQPGDGLWLDVQERVTIWCGARPRTCARPPERPR